VPVDGIGGFSQGALIAAAVAAEAQPQVRWLLNVCGMPWQWLHVSVRSNLPAVALPSLHVVCETDPTLSRELAHSLPTRCNRPSVFLHEEGHALPRLQGPLATKLRTFLEESARWEGPPNGMPNTPRSSDAATTPRDGGVATIVPGAPMAGPSGVAVAEVTAVEMARGRNASGTRDDGTADMATEMGDGFVWRKMVERQRQWYESDGDTAEGHRPLRDSSARFVSSAANPLPQLSPQVGQSAGWSVRRLVSPQVGQSAGWSVRRLVSHHP
jgi:hypothetical protein